MNARPAEKLDHAPTAPVVIVNPTASSGGAGERWPGIEAALKVRFQDMRVQQTEAPGHATELCRTALEAGADMIISVGGDGTTNEILAGFCDAEGRNRFPDAVLGIIASGTGGDFQRQFGVVSPVRQVDRLCGAPVRTIDYAIARYIDHDGNEVTRPYLNSASVGVSGLVVNYIGSANKALGNTVAYATSSLKGILNWRNVQVHVSHDDEAPRRVDLSLACVFNGEYFGAGMWACPHAELDDGKLATTELIAMKKTTIAGTLAKVYKGQHTRVRGVTTSKVRKVSYEPIDSRATVLIELDGEQPGRLPASFEVVPSGIKIRVA